MAEISSELVLEVLKPIQNRLVKMDGKIDEVKGELTALRAYAYGIHQDIGNIYSMLGRHDARLERIERRLELREPEPA